MTKTEVSTSHERRIACHDMTRSHATHLLGLGLANALLDNVVERLHALVDVAVHRGAVVVRVGALLGDVGGALFDRLHTGQDGWNTRGRA